MLRRFTQLQLFRLRKHAKVIKLLIRAIQGLYASQIRVRSCDSNELYCFTDLKHRLLSSKIRLSKRAPELHTKRKDTTSINKLIEHSQSSSIVPDNPSTPAFWIAEGRYRRHFFAARENEKQKILDSDSREKSTRKIKPDEPHPSRICYAPVYGMHTGLQPKIVTTMPVSLSEEAQKRETKEEEIEGESEKELKETTKVKSEEGEETGLESWCSKGRERHPVPQRVDMTKTILMREPVPPRQPRRIYRYHHIQ